MKQCCPLWMLIALVITGCGIEQRPPADKQAFLLDVQRPGPAAAAVATTLRVRFCGIAAPFSGRSLVYRTGAVQYEQDAYNTFLTSPDEQVTDAVRQWFRDAGLTVCRQADLEPAGPLLTLHPRVDVLCADFSDRDRPAAVVRMHVLVTTMDPSCHCVRKVLDKTLTAETGLPAVPTAAEVVKALSQSLTDILTTLETDLISLD